MEEKFLIEDDAKVVISSPLNNKSTFPKTARLLKSHEFQKVRTKGRQLVGDFIVMQVLSLSSANRSKLGLSVPRQYGKANLRNSFKRQIREIFRVTQSVSQQIHIKPRATAKEASFAELREEFHRLLDIFKTRKS